MQEPERPKTRRIHVEVPEDLFIMLKKIAFDKGISIKSIIVQYLRFLKKQDRLKRSILSNQSRYTSFEVQENKENDEEDFDEEEEFNGTLARLRPRDEPQSRVFYS